MYVTRLVSRGNFIFTFLPARVSILREKNLILGGNAVQPAVETIFGQEERVGKKESPRDRPNFFILSIPYLVGY